MLAALVMGLLPFSAATAEAPSGTHTATGYVDVQGIVVRFYRSTTGQDSGPFTLAASTTSENYGAFTIFSVSLPDGTYRATFNEHEDGSVKSRIYAPQDWTDENTGSRTFVVDGNDTFLSSTYLDYKAGQVKGAVSDVCDNYSAAGTVEAYAADDSDPAHASTWYTVSTYDRQYSAHGFAGPTKFKLTGPGHEPRWVGGDSFSNATTYTIPAGSVIDGPDIFLTKTFSPGATGQVTGTVELGSSLDGVGGLVVRFYRSASDTPDGPWTLQAQTTSSGGTRLGAGLGDFDTKLPTGLYRVTVNDTPDGTPASIGYSSAIYKKGWEYQGSDFEDADNICVDGWTTLGHLAVAPSGGTITGTVVNARHEPLRDVTVELFPGSSSGLADQAVRTVKTNYEGEYSIASIDGPAKLRFTAAKDDVYGGSATIYNTEWTGDAVDPAHASTITVPVGQTAKADAMLADAPITILEKPSVKGRIRVGQAAFGDAGYSSLDPINAAAPKARKSYQWLRNTGSRSHVIKGATKRYYVPTGADIGHTLSLRVRFSAPKGFPGVAPVTVTSKPSKLVRTHASVRVSAKAVGSGRFKVTAKIGVKGRPRPSGTAYVQWIALKRKGDYLYPTGKTHTKKVHYSRGRLRYTAKATRKGYWAYGVVVVDTKTIIGAHDDDFLKVR